MKQPIRKIIKIKKTKPIKKSIPIKASSKKGIKYGTSKLEKDFAREFLDKYGIQYIYEYEARNIGRYYDFAIVTKKSKYITEEKEGLQSIIQGIQHTPIDLLIEIDGQYFHSDPRFYDENNLNAMQKRNKMVDELKDKWASMHCIPLLRIWEYDIRHNPKKVLEELKKYIHIEESTIKTESKRVMKLKKR
jgi:hypothetical protein